MIKKLKIGNKVNFTVKQILWLKNHVEQISIEIKNRCSIKNVLPSRIKNVKD